MTYDEIKAMKAVKTELEEIKGMWNSVSESLTEVKNRSESVTESLTEVKNRSKLLEENMESMRKTIADTIAIIETLDYCKVCFSTKTESVCTNPKCVMGGIGSR